MITPRLVLCGGASTSGIQGGSGQTVVRLSTRGASANVNLQLEDVAKAFSRHLSPRLVDLLEIAAYVFTADCATKRGGKWADEGATEPWSRDFDFVIPVRDHEFWSDTVVGHLLPKVLNFLSDDNYSFRFLPLEDDGVRQAYLDFAGWDDWPFYGVDRVILFSGGLDSLAGAVDTAARGERLVLVSHRSEPTISRRQRTLFDELKRSYAVPMVRIPVWVNKDGALGREHTQRTRSFLFSALGTAVAESFHASGVRFFENGIVSINLPVADEALRSRASRTTHPRVLQMLSEFYSLITERPFEIDNPYMFMTKAEVVSTIPKNGAGHLIQHSCSCAHQGHFKSKTQWHCGTCSQCIDRRIAILANGLEHLDPETDYVSDVFSGPRTDGYEKNMGVGYVRHALGLYQMSEEEIAAEFNLELTRAARPFPKRAAAAQRMVEMHKRHAETVRGVLLHKLQEHAGQILDGTVEESSMLAMAAGLKHKQQSWRSFCERIGDILAKGLPILCQTHQPKNETHLQQLSDGLLKTNGCDLEREFPFARWSSSLTKPDWSAEGMNLWVEMKYVRAKEDTRRMTEEIAADITKYGDNGRRCLYVICDLSGAIPDRQQFAEPILRREDMVVRFVP